MIHDASRMCMIYSMYLPTCPWPVLKSHPFKDTASYSTQTAAKSFSWEPIILSHWSCYETENAVYIYIYVMKLYIVMKCYEPLNNIVRIFIHPSPALPDSKLGPNLGWSGCSAAEVPAFRVDKIWGVGLSSCRTFAPNDSKYIIWFCTSMYFL